MLAVVLFICSLVAWPPAVNFGQFVDAAAAVLADVFVLAAADAVALAAVTVWDAASAVCGAVTACLAVDPGPRSAVVLVHVA